MEKRFEAIEDLIRQVETKAADEPDTLALLLVKFAEVDRYLLNGRVASNDGSVTVWWSSGWPPLH